MSQKTYNILKDAKSRALIDDETYQKWYKQSIKDPEKFWGKHGKRIDWFKPYTKVKNTSFTGKVSIKWFEDGLTNVSYNCIDRHLDKRGDQVAIIWEGDNPYDDKKITYRELHEQVCKLGQRDEGERRQEGRPGHHLHADDPEAAYAMLACARIGAIHSIVFGGFSPDALPAASSTANQPSSSPPTKACAAARRFRSSTTPTRARDRPARPCSSSSAPAARSSGSPTATSGTTRQLAAAKPDCEPKKMNAEDPLFILYTSGLDRQAQGRAAHHRRLSRLRVDDPPVRLRLPRRRYLLVHRRCRLGHRPLLHRLRPARQRRDDADVRGRAEPIRRRAASGRWSTSTRSTSSTPRRPRSAR
jgi:acetyl-CoA synthetase